MPPLQKKTTSSIFYRINQDDDSNNIIAHQSKRSKLTKLKPSSTIKKNKLHKQKLQSYKNAFPTSEQELAHHVQSYFSDNFNEEERDDDECTILSEEEDASSRLEYCKKLAAHPALVLNADYRVSCPHCHDWAWFCFMDSASTYHSK